MKNCTVLRPGSYFQSETIQPSFTLDDISSLLLMKALSRTSLPTDYTNSEDSSLVLSFNFSGYIPGSPIHGIFQARVLEWGAFAFSVLNLGLTIYLAAQA